MEIGALIPNKDEKQHQHELHVQEIDSKIKELPLKDRIKAVALNYHYEEKSKLDEELSQKISLLQKEYDQRSLPIYAEQRAIINGERAPTAEELAQFKDFFTEQELAEAETLKETKERIPNYWGQVLTNCDALSHVWGEKDKEILKFLDSVELETSADTQVFTLTFHFRQNEYFTNKELSKKFIIEDNADFPKSTIGTPIEWNDGKDVTVKMIEKKQKNKKTGATRVIKKKQTQLSFFNFFKNTEDHEEDHKKEDKDEENNDIDKDYEIGKTIAEECIPFSLEYYLGINPEEDDYEDCDEEDDEENDDDDEEEDDKKDSDEDDKDKKKHKKDRKKSGDSKKSDKASKAPKQDCKQQ